MGEIRFEVYYPSLRDVKDFISIDYKSILENKEIKKIISNFFKNDFTKSVFGATKIYYLTSKINEKKSIQLGSLEPLKKRKFLTKPFEFSRTKEREGVTNAFLLIFKDERKNSKELLTTDEIKKIINVLSNTLKKDEKEIKIIHQ